MPLCDICTSGFSRTKPFISCDGCKKQFHTNCISRQIDILAALNAVPGLLWRCNDCQKNCVLIDQSGISNIVGIKLDESLQQLKCKFDYATNEIMKKNSVTPRYSDIVKNKTEPAVLIVPKNSSQLPNQLKSDMLDNINPVENNLHLSRVRTTKDGGLLVGCQNKEENEKFVSLVREKLSDSYVIREVNGIKPRIRIAGMTENHTERDIKQFLMNCNSHIFSEIASINIIKVGPHKKNSELFQAVIEVDKSSYVNSLKSKNVFIGYDSCAVFDAVDVYRCYKCNEFHHSAANCQNRTYCPICSEEHELKDCKSNIKKCSNCVKFNERTKSSISTNHTVWDREKCACYKNATAKLTRDLTTDQ